MISETTGLKRNVALTSIFLLSIFIAFNFGASATLATGGDVQVTVNDWFGNPIDNTTVSMYNSTNDVLISQSTVGTAGVYTIPNKTIVNNGTTNSTLYYILVTQPGFGTANSSHSLSWVNDSDPNVAGTFNISSNIEVFVRNSWVGNAGVPSAHVILHNDSGTAIAQGVTNSSGYITFVANETVDNSSTDIYFNNATELVAYASNVNQTYASKYYVFINVTGYATYNMSTSFYNTTNTTGLMSNTTDMNPIARIIIEDFSNENITGTVAVYNDSDYTQQVYNISNQVVGPETENVYNLTVNGSYPTLHYQVTKTGYGIYNASFSITQNGSYSNTSVAHIGPNILVYVTTRWNSTVISGATVNLWNSSTVNESADKVASGTTNSSGYVLFTSRYDNSSTTSTDLFFNVTEIGNTSFFNVSVSMSDYDAATVGNFHYGNISAPHSVNVPMNDSVAPPEVEVWIVQGTDGAGLTSVYAENITVKVNTSDVHGIMSVRYRIRENGTAYTGDRILINWTNMTADSQTWSNYTSEIITSVFIPVGNWTIDVNVTDNPGNVNATNTNGANFTVASHEAILVTPLQSVSGSTSVGGSTLSIPFDIKIKGNNTENNLQCYVNMASGGTPFLSAPDENKLFIKTDVNTTARRCGVVGAYTNAQSIVLSNITSLPPVLVPSATTNLTVMKGKIFNDTVTLYINPYSGVSAGTYTGTYGFKWVNE